MWIQTYGEIFKSALVYLQKDNTEKNGSEKSRIEVFFFHSDALNVTFPKYWGLDEKLYFLEYFKRFHF